MIHFHCEPSDSLLWKEEENASFCRFHLGLEKPFFPLDDPMHFESLAFALKEWTSKVWPKMEGKLKGALLYCGSADFASSFLWTEKGQANWEEWRKENLGFSESHAKRLFCADAFVYYFQMLSHSLPDELPLHLWLDAKGLGSLAQTHQIISQERFAHFQIATQNLPLANGPTWEGERLLLPQDPKSSAFCFPEDRMCDDALLAKIDAVLEKFTGRVIGEPFLIEELEGIDVLHVLKGWTTPQGDRKIKGFLATGGKVIFES